jgi:GNAT superfamily N-acetyltransferase
MIIRRATQEDLEGICKVAESVKLDYSKPQKSGFLVYCLSKDQYANRLESSDYFYVATDQNKVIGFLMCYDDETLKDLIKNGNLDHEAHLAKKVAEQNGRYTFGDQIGVFPDKALTGVGTALMTALFEDMKAVNINTIYVGILHKPVMNIASKQFCENLGFMCRESVINSDNHEWGFYKLELPEKL